MTVGTPNRSQAGFTLVEMLVALAIFAILAAAGVGLLRVSVDTQSAVERRLGDLRQLSRLQTLLASDLGQATARATRDASGLRPEFRGSGGQMAFVRGGWFNPDGAPRSDLQRVEWRLEQGQLVRIGHARLDGHDGGQPAVLARDVESAVFRYRRGDGSWNSIFTSAPGEGLPAAVELTLTRRGEAPIRFVTALALQGSAEPDQRQAKGGP